jgi:hypothetical protein
LDVAQHSEAVEAELTRFIEKRHDQRRVKTEGEQLEEELWKESERRYLEIKQRRRVAAWFAHFCRMAEVATGPYRRTTSAGPRSSARKERWHRDLCLKVTEHAA